MLEKDADAIRRAIEMLLLIEADSAEVEWMLDKPVADGLRNMKIDPVDDAGNDPVSCWRRQQDQHEEDRKEAG
jgi:hypothetical protein